MHNQQVNRVSGRILVALSLTALLPVLGGYLPGHPPQADEGTGAHIFQLSIVAVVPMMLLFLVTADWTQPNGATPYLRGDCPVPSAVSLQLRVALDEAAPPLLSRPAVFDPAVQPVGGCIRHSRRS